MKMMTYPLGMGRRFPRGKRGLKSGRRAERLLLPGSLPPREAWIEIARSPPLGPGLGSLPPREAWIEMMSVVSQNCPLASLPPREAWIEICNYNQVGLRRAGRFPRGKRGLK